MKDRLSVAPAAALQSDAAPAKERVALGELPCLAHESPVDLASAAPPRKLLDESKSPASFLSMSPAQQAAAAQRARSSRLSRPTHTAGEGVGGTDGSLQRYKVLHAADAAQGVGRAAPVVQDRVPLAAPSRNGLPRRGEGGRSGSSGIASVCAAAGVLGGSARRVPADSTWACAAEPQEPRGVPAPAKAKPDAAGGDRCADPSSDLFAPPAHPLADTEPARRTPPATRRVDEPRASAGGMDGAHAAAGLARLLESLQAKASSRAEHVGDLKLSMATEFENVAREAHAAALARARRDNDIEQRLALVEHGARGARLELAALAKRQKRADVRDQELGQKMDQLGQHIASLEAHGLAQSEAPTERSPVAAGAALGYLQDNAAFVPCSASAGSAATASAWAEARAEQSRQGEAIRTLEADAEVRARSVKVCLAALTAASEAAAERLTALEAAARAMASERACGGACLDGLKPHQACTEAGARAAGTAVRGAGCPPAAAGTDPSPDLEGAAGGCAAPGWAPTGPPPSADAGADGVVYVGLCSPAGADAVAAAGAGAPGAEPGPAGPAADASGAGVSSGVRGGRVGGGKGATAAARNGRPGHGKQGCGCVVS